jgi:hypothetical protein
MRATCTQCKTLLDEAARFCKSCGRAVQPNGQPPADATMIIDRQRAPAQSPVPPPPALPLASTTGGAQTPHRASTPATQHDDLPSETTVIVNVVKPTRDLPPPPPPQGFAIGASPARGVPAGTTRGMPPPDTGIGPDADVAGWTQVTYLEASLLQRPLAQARTLRTLRRNEPVGVVRYQGAYVAVRLPDGATGYVARQALATGVAAPELSSPEDDFASATNIARVREEGAAFRPEPSRLAAPLRAMHAGEPVQLRSFTAFFAHVRTVDGTAGYVERADLGRSGGGALHGGRSPVGPFAFAALAALALIGVLLPWTSACVGCASDSGFDHPEGVFVFLLALAAAGLVFAFYRIAVAPLERLLLGMSACGGAVALLALIARSGDSYSFESGVYVTLIAGLGMAAAPWIDRLQVMLAANAAPRGGGHG